MGDQKGNTDAEVIISFTAHFTERPCEKVLNLEKFLLMEAMSQGEDHELILEWKLGKRIQSLQHSEHDLSLFHSLKQKQSAANFQTSLSPNVYHLLLCDAKKFQEFKNDIFLQKSENGVAFLTREEHIQQKTSQKIYLLNFEEKFTVAKLLGGKLELLDDHPQREGEMYLQAAKYIKAAAVQLHHDPLVQQQLGIMTVGENQTEEELLEAFVEAIQQHSHLAMFSQPDIFKMIIREHQRGNSLFSFMALSAFLEQSLQDAVSALYLQKGDYTSYKKFNETLPKFSALLTMQEMKTLFGDGVALLLKCFIGPLTSMNLRNITLHGFMAPHEFQPCYTTLLIMLSISLSSRLDPALLQVKSKVNIASLLPVLDAGNSLKRTECTAATAFYRPVISLEKYDWFADDTGLFANLQLEKFLSDSSNGNRFMLHKSIHQLLDRSFFVLSAWKPLWEQSFEAYCSGNYYQSLMTLFPALEHCIRRIFVCVNARCSQSLLTAENTSAYTTLDVLLSTIPTAVPSPSESTSEETVTTTSAPSAITFVSLKNTKSVNHQYHQQSGGEQKQFVKNQIFEELGETISNLLFDLFIWDSSPRPRDLFCHGNVNPFTINKDFTTKVIAMCLYLCFKFDIAHTDKEISESYFERTNLPREFLNMVQFFEKTYIPRHHPKNVLISKIQQLNASLIQEQKELKASADIRASFKYYALSGNPSATITTPASSTPLPPTAVSELLSKSKLASFVVAQFIAEQDSQTLQTIFATSKAVKAKLKEWISRFERNLNPFLDSLASSTSSSASSPTASSFRLFSVEIPLKENKNLALISKILDDTIDAHTKFQLVANDFSSAVFSSSPFPQLKKRQFPALFYCLVHRKLFALFTKFLLYACCFELLQGTKEVSNLISIPCYSFCGAMNSKTYAVAFEVLAACFLHKHSSKTLNIKVEKLYMHDTLCKIMEKVGWR